MSEQAKQAAPQAATEEMKPRDHPRSAWSDGITTLRLERVAETTLRAKKQTVTTTQPRGFSLMIFSNMRNGRVTNRSVGSS